MAHEHTHSDSAHSMEQFATIGVTLGFGIAALIMGLDPQQKMLSLILAPKLHTPVLACGIALIALAIIRSIYLVYTMLSRPKPQEHVHDDAPMHEEIVQVGVGTHAHEHAHSDCCHYEHDHAHEVCDHPHEEDEQESCCAGHDHNHDSVWTNVRYVILLLPVGLFLMGLPDKSLREAHGADAAGLETQASPAQAGQQAAQIQAAIATNLASGSQLAGAAALFPGSTFWLPPPDKGEMQLGFKELDEASNLPMKRDYYTGHRGRLTGQLTRSENDPRIFTLARFKMTCCARDAVTIHVFVASPQPVPTSFADGGWVEARGRLEFRQREGRYVPVLVMSSVKDDLKRVPPEPSVFISQ